MDYGKLAYLKTDDITKRVDKLERKSLTGLKSIKLGSAAAATVGSGFWTEPMRFSSGSDNSLTVLMKLRFEHTAAASVTVNAEINGALFHTEDIRLNAGIADYFAIAVAVGAKDYNNSLRIGLEGEGYSGTLVSYDAVVWGDSVGVHDSDIMLAVLDGETSVAAAIVGGDLVCWLTQGGKFAFGAAPEVVARDIKDFDMARDIGGNGIRFVTVDNQNQLRLISYGNGQVNAQVVIEYGGVSSAALITYPHSAMMTVAYVSGGKLMVCEMEYNASVLGKAECNTAIKNIESVRAVNGAEVPMLLIKSEDNRVFVKAAERFFKVNESVIRNNATLTMGTQVMP